MGPNKDTAVASYILHVRTKLKDGKITDEDNQESDVMFKRNGQWKVVFLHYSTAPKK
jgi:ketosteroid isomerase-like protein